MISIDSGSLDRRIVLQRSTKSKDSFGQPVETFNTLATVWAQFTPVSDSEKERANEVHSELMGRFIVRWSTSIADLGTTDRVFFDGRSFDIRGVKEIGRHVGFEITAATRGER